ncbi:MAG: DUF4019 domain-containing protein [Desulfarculaceae bacterium]|nr:DUF4019 domain-containing protein [Desulfarculaceae bacterium]MCF8073676.1 DUF4019 domain-containing protein [Desulfarculaceae bacterium]MCF8101917.1 DUF4019 domain-containing protein [Desulfarculaceae bacterium]MCF8117660.1 DUF4019 domain-containing protein [Desulfarculaceae bacterium]
MKKALITCLAAALLLALALPALAEKEHPGADKAARAWLALLDNHKYATAWDQAGAMMQKGIPKAEWEKRLAKVAETTGPSTDRKLLRSVELDGPPNAPPGKYLILIYGPLFLNKPKLVEQLAMIQDAKGKWQVVGYYLK